MKLPWPEKVSPGRLVKPVYFLVPVDQGQDYARLTAKLQAPTVNAQVVRTPIPRSGSSLTAGPMAALHFGTPAAAFDLQSKVVDPYTNRDID